MWEYTTRDMPCSTPSPFPPSAGGGMTYELDISLVFVASILPWSEDNRESHALHIGVIGCHTVSTVRWYVRSQPCFLHLEHSVVHVPCPFCVYYLQYFGFAENFDREISVGTYSLGSLNFVALTEVRLTNDLQPPSNYWMTTC